MAGAHDNLGCCGLLECLCGLVQVFLDPRPGGFLFWNPPPGSRSSQTEWTGPAWGVETSSARPVAREPRFDHRVSPVAWNSPDPRSTYSQVGGTRSPWDVATSSVPPVAARGLRSDHRVDDRSPVAWNSPDLRSRYPQAATTSSSRDVPTVARNSTAQQNGMAGCIEDDDDDDDCVIVAEKGEMVYGRPLTVNITAPRGSPRVDTARSQSVSPFKIFICNLPTQVDRPRLEELFSKHGKVVDARVIYERQGEDWCSRGFGFVTMATEEEMNSAIRALNKQVLEGHALKVEVARDMRPQQGRLSPSNQTPLQNSTSQNQNTHTSDDLSPVARNLQQKGMAAAIDKDDDDCVILDYDLHSTAAVKDEKEGSVGDGGLDDELQIVAEKGEVACRDFPHSRHLCSNMPFGTTSHNKHCTMCYCFVCDAPAPCSYWGKGLSVDDHCHATDKETKWEKLREAFKQRSNGSGISNGQSAQISHQLALTASALRAHSAAGAGRGTSNAHTAQISHPVAPTASAPRAQPAAGAGRGTSNAHTAQISRPLALPGSAPRATSAARVQSGTGNGHSAQVTHLVEPTGSGARAHPAAGAGRGTSNAHAAQISHPVTPTVSAARAQPAAGAGRGTSNARTALVTHPVEATVSPARSYSSVRTGTGTSNTHTSQITPVEPTVGSTRAYSAARFGRGTSNATTSQTPRSAEQTVSAPRVYPGARVGRDSSNAHSAPEGTTLYVGNLPGRIDNETLKLTFQHAGVVLFSKVIYDRETGQSRGFGYVTMNTVQEAETAVRMYNGSMVYGRPLTVNITAPRGSPRVDTARSQSVSPFKIFICNLPTQVDRPRLEELFSKHGKVVDARVIYERQGEDWCSRGFGFVTMATEEEMNSAIRALNKQVLEGHALKVEVARDMRPQQGRLSPSNQTPLQNSTSQNQNTHTSVRASLSAAPTASATTGRSGTSNADTAQVTH
ncbi:hypothetical protein ACQ4PT_030429 [Festuca glaucescens]